ncbi:hypothetical protein HYY75_06510 [bacterium]|nr:hypothetical protein [bacterium]
MISSTKPISYLCIIGYLLFMSLAIDSSILDALIFYVSEKDGKPLYKTGKIVLKPLAKEKGDPSRIVAIQFQGKESRVASELSSSSTKVQSSETKSFPGLEKQVGSHISSSGPVLDGYANEKKPIEKPGIPGLTAQERSRNLERLGVSKKSPIVQTSKIVKPVPAQALGVKSDLMLSSTQEKLAPSLSPSSIVSKETNQDVPKISTSNSGFVGGKVSILSLIKSIPERPWVYNSALDRFVVKYDSETDLVLTIRPALQRALETLFNRFSCKIGAAIIEDPVTGAVFAMTSFDGHRAISPSDRDFSMNNWALKATFPVASLFKIITASAGFERKLVTPSSRFKVGKKATIEFWRAFATSHNGVFGAVGRAVGANILQNFANSFGFNKPFYFDLPVSQSVGVVPDKAGLVGQTAAGLNKNVEISPIHVSSIISTILTNGKLMKPYLVETVVHRGKVVFRRKPFQLGQPISSTTAATIHEMMRMTITHGTGRKGFNMYKDVPELAHLCGGKTGTLTGLDPKLLFTWFGGFTKAAGRELSLVVLVGGGQGRGVKATNLAGRFSHDLYVGTALQK